MNTLSKMTKTLYRNNKKVVHAEYVAHLLLPYILYTQKKQKKEREKETKKNKKKKFYNLKTPV